MDLGIEVNFITDEVAFPSKEQAFSLYQSCKVVQPGSTFR